MTKDKFILKSKTVQGLIVVALPTVLDLFNIDLGAQFAEHVDGGLTSLIELIGAVWAAIGLRMADKQLSITPK